MIYLVLAGWLLTLAAIWYEYINARCIQKQLKFIDDILKAHATLLETQEQRAHRIKEKLS